MFVSLALPALAQTVTPTETATPAPTATLTLPAHVYLNGFDERTWRELGPFIFILIVFGLGLAAVIAAPYLKRWNARREVTAEKVVDRVLDGDVLDAVTRAYLEKFEKKYSRFSFRGLEDVSGAKIPEFNTAYISLRLAGRPEKELTRLRGKEDDSELNERREGASEIDLSEAVNRSSRLAIVGAAGSGKSTLLQWAGITVARNRLRGERKLTEPQHQWIATLHNPKLLPIFISLRDYVRSCREAKRPITPPPQTTAPAPAPV